MLKLRLPLAEQGDATVQYNLGLMYDDGTGVPQDDAAAEKWYGLAAGQGCARGEVNLDELRRKTGT